MIINRDVHGSGWEDFLIQPTMVGQKNSTQPNPHGSGWTHGFDKFFIIIIIIKLSKKILILIY